MPDDANGPDLDHVLIAGAGYVGARLAEMLVEDGVRVTGLKRDPSTLPDGVEPFAADVTDPGTLGGLPDRLDAVVYAVAPASRDPDTYQAAYVDGPRNVLRVVERIDDPPSRVILVSSTGVYGHMDGQWVDEETPPAPRGRTGALILEGESVVRAMAPEGIALRLGGIYGPGRNRTLRRIVDGEARCPRPDAYGNRIHRDDAAGAARHLLTVPRPMPVYLGVDRDPAPLREVYRWVAGRAGGPDPCAEDEPESWEPEGRRGSNKRCSSQRLVDSGYTFRYPTYREGYGALLDELLER